MTRLALVPPLPDERMRGYTSMLTAARESAYRDASYWALTSLVPGSLEHKTVSVMMAYGTMVVCDDVEVDDDLELMHALAVAYDVANAERDTGEDW